MLKIVTLLIVQALSLKIYSLPSINNPPSARQNTKTCLDKFTNKLYVFGGMTEAGKLANDLWVFDLDDRVWHEMPMVTEDRPSPRYGHGCFINQVTRDLYIFGGEGSKVELNDLWAYSLTKLTVS